MAVRWLRSSAAPLRINPARICTWGISAGGHLAMFLGLLDRVHQGDMAAILPDLSSKVQCVVSISGPTDLTRTTAAIHGGATTFLFGGRRIKDDPAPYRDASPLYAANPAAAPMLLVYGEQDKLVPIDQGKAMRAALQQNGVAAELLQHRGGHVGANLTAEESRANYLRIIAFLKSHLGG